MTVKRAGRVVVALVAAMLAVAILFPVFAQAKACSKCVTPLSDVKRLGLGELMYAEDHDERFTPRDVWMDAIYPYVRDWRRFHARPAPKGAWGYAFNGALDAAKPPQDAARVPMIYDSANPIKNASDLVTSLPSPGRHAGKDLIAYADGHARMVRP